MIWDSEFDAKHGNDRNSGTEKAPWRTLTNTLRRVRPGDTLYLRGKRVKIAVKVVDIFGNDTMTIVHVAVGVRK